MANRQENCHTSDEQDEDLRTLTDFQIEDGYTIPAKSVITFTGSIVDTTQGNIPDFDPNKYSLFQNYPNPFNGTTTFQYYLPESSNVQVNVYSVLGQKIKKRTKNLE